MAVATANRQPDLSWLDAPADALPGKAAHVALVTQALTFVDGPDLEDAPYVCSPLLSQPVVEACLQVPSWLWFERGFNRAVARDAFADMLPASVVWRRSKGSPDEFIAAVYEANRSLIRDMLLGGALACNGLLDLPAIAAVLNDPRPVVGHDHLRILRLVDAEAWARAWLG